MKKSMFRRKSCKGGNLKILNRELVKLRRALDELIKCFKFEKN